MRKTITIYLILTSLLVGTITYSQTFGGVLPPFYIDSSENLNLRQAILQRGEILVASTTSQFYKLATGTEGYVLTISSGIPAWAVSAGGGVASLNSLTGALTLWGTSPLTITASSTVGLVFAYTEADPLWTASSTNFGNWNTAYGWGNHSLAGYLTTVDISANTNLTVTNPIVLTDDALSLNTASSSLWQTAYTHSQLTSGNPHSITKSDVGLANVENTALSTWGGSTNILTVGTIGTGTWNATPIAYDYGGTGTSTILANQYLWWGDGSGGLVQIASSTLAGAAAGVSSLHAFTGALDIWGTTNQLTVTASSTVGLVLSLPQNIHTGASPTFAGISLGNTGLHLADTDDSHDLVIQPLSDFTLQRTLGISTGDSDRTITLSGNPTLANWFNQDVKSTSTPTFAGLTLTGFTGFLKGTAGVVGTSTIGFTDLTGAATDAQIPNNITIDLAGTATALASNPTDCGAGTKAISIDASGNLTCSAVDISADTNLAAGRSLTMSGDSVEADAELFTRSFSIPIKNATTTSNPAAQHSLPTAITITKVKCRNSSGTTTIQFDERIETTQWTAGTDIMSAVLQCGTSALASTTAFANAGIAANAWISLDLDSVLGGATSTSITVSYTVDD